MNNAIVLVMLSLMGAYAVYFLIKTNQNTKTEQNNNIPLHIIIGMIIGAILGWFIALYLYGLIKTKGEGDAFYVLISSLFLSVLGGIKFLGFLGFILGPLIAALCLSLFEIYTEEG